MFEKIKQFKNLIMLVVLFLLLIWCDPLLFFSKKAHERAMIHNLMQIEKAETERKIAIIKAQTEAELKRIWNED